MVKQQKKLSELAELLRKPDAIILTQAIEILRDEKPFEGAINLLSDCYDSNTNASVLKAIENFMNDMKESSLRDELVKEITNDHKPATKAMLVASCWQSGLDYSGYCRAFTEVFLKSDYLVAIECLTVIEESSDQLSNDQKREMITLVKNLTSDQPVEKEPLVSELRSILMR